MLRMAMRLLRREWRSGELAVLLVSLAVAVAALTGVGFLVDRIGRAVQAQASEVLAADARVESPAAFTAAGDGGAKPGAPERAPHDPDLGRIPGRCQPACQCARGQCRLPAAWQLEDSGAGLCRRGCDAPDTRGGQLLAGLATRGIAGRPPGRYAHGRGARAARRADSDRAP